MRRQYQSDLAVEARLLRKKAVWCGTVFALALLLTALNSLPPASIHYQVVSKVVISEARLQRLQECVQAERVGKTQTEFDVKLIDVKVLDRASNEAAGSFGDLASDEIKRNLILVQVKSLWRVRASEENHLAWLEQVSIVDSRAIADSDAAREHRFAKWELEAATHYVAHHKFRDAAKSQVTFPEGDPSRLAEDQQPRRIFALASHATTAQSASATTSAEAIEEQDPALEQLTETVQIAARNFELATQRRDSLVDSASGLLEMSSEPQVQPRVNAMPRTIVFSVLLLGIGIGSIAGWIQYRLQSGGAFDPLATARQLAEEGLPQLATIALPIDDLEAEDWVDRAGRKASQAGRRVARQMVMIGEFAVGFWSIMFLGRLLLDSMWRAILIESPLAGLSLLLSGLP